ncbi:helix-turn-helix domain-containing protein [Flavobacterium sp. HNIBRBA15423]
MSYLSQYINVNMANNILKIRFSTLEAICKVLECQPGDILEYSE